jgi:hypothetical protein
VPSKNITVIVFEVDACRLAKTILFIWNMCEAAGVDKTVTVPPAAVRIPATLVKLETPLAKTIS